MTWGEESKNTAELEAQFAGAGLFMAAQNNEVADVKKQIEAGIDPNSTMADGLTPLFMVGSQSLSDDLPKQMLGCSLSALLSVSVCTSSTQLTHSL
jgi:hypothetical protein